MWAIDDIIPWHDIGATMLVPVLTVVLVSLSLAYLLWLLLPNMFGALGALLATTATIVVIMHYQGNLDHLRHQAATRLAMLEHARGTALAAALSDRMAPVSRTDSRRVSPPRRPPSAASSGSSQGPPPLTVAARTQVLAPGLQRIFHASR